MFGIGNGGRIRGGPRRRWMDEVVETTGLRLQESPGDVCVPMEQGDKVR